MFNQSETADLKVLESEGYLPANLPHTLVLNADQKVLSFVDPLRHIGKLILTNGDNQCTSIGDDFLSGCTILATFNTQGFSNVTFIGYGFLADTPLAGENLRQQILNRGPLSKPEDKEQS